MKIDQFAAAMNPAFTASAEKINHVARELEGQFAQLLIKSMRNASFGDALFPEENQLFREMHDQKIAKTLTQGKGLGIAAMVARQLGGLQKKDEPTARADDSLVRKLSKKPSPPPPRSEPHTPESFVKEIWHHAQKAARELGVDARALVAQAALETGWGKHAIKREGGRSSHNLFGIKATGWQGERATAQTHEYRNGVRQNERAAFRAYSSVADSFADYVKLIKHNPRYQQALQSGGNVREFATALQQAGYATDPSYAKKINAIANGPILKQILAKMTDVIHHPG